MATTFVPLVELADGLKFRYPVYAKVEQHENLFIAYCPTVGCSRHGGDYEDTLNDLKRQIIKEYRDLLSRYPDLNDEQTDLVKIMCALLGEEMPIKESIRKLVQEGIKEHLSGNKNEQ